jgi:hypothetical protein
MNRRRRSLSHSSHETRGLLVAYGLTEEPYLFEDGQASVQALAGQEHEGDVLLGVMVRQPDGQFDR